MAIGEWRRGPTIGRGSTATVSVAVASPSGLVFAVKSAELSFSAPLQREQAILSSLRHHPNVVSCLGFDAAGGVYNLFLEYAPLGSLSDRISACGSRLEEPEIRSYAGDILHGLAHLHAAGVAHCDVKARNVLLWPGGGAKLADFGCARRASGEESSVALAGTPMYMAPEAARGEEQGAPADVWALGCTVVEMATGRPPWPDIADPVSALHRVGFTGDVPECPGWLSPEASDFVAKCLTRDARERWTAEQLLRHPFVSCKTTCTPENTTPPADQVWISPKSTLEQGMWDSEEEEEEHHSDSPGERLRLLAGGVSQAINWETDGNWITVRSNENESAATTAEDDLVPSEQHSFDSIQSDVPGDRNDPFAGESMNQTVEQTHSPLDSSSKNAIFFSNFLHFNYVLHSLVKQKTVIIFFQEIKRGTPLTSYFVDEMEHKFRRLA